VIHLQPTAIGKHFPTNGSILGGIYLHDVNKQVGEVGEGNENAYQSKSVSQKDIYQWFTNEG
jgi:hypothetical protein